MVENVTNDGRVIARHWSATLVKSAWAPERDANTIHACFEIVTGGLAATLGVGTRPRKATRASAPTRASVVSVRQEQSPILN